MLRKMGLAILLLVIILPAWGLTEGRLLNQSTSGRTVLFNLGSLDGIKESDYAIIAKQVQSEDASDLKVIPVAKGRNIKLNTDSSVWILYEIKEKDLLKRGGKYIVLSESYMLRGRRDPKVGRVTVVTEKDQIEAQVKHALTDDKNRLSKLKSGYQKIQDTRDEEPLSEKDVELLNVQTWEKNKNTRHRSFLYRSASKDEFQRQHRLATFEKMVAAYFEKVNDPEFNYSAFHEKHKKDKFSNELSANGNFDSEYNKFLRQEARQASADAKLFRTILEKGEAWSQDYSDEELRIVLNQVSALQEKDRRLFVVAKPTRYMVGLGLGFDLNDAQTDDDQRYRRDNRYSSEVDFEVTPFLKHADLERFTLNGTFRLNYTAFQAGQSNADFNEYSVTLGANWYPWYAPHAVESPVFFLGTYIRSGFAKATTPALNENANYTVLSVPGFRTGFKYMMRNNFGLRLILSLETLEIERYEVSRLNATLPEETNIAEGKMAVSLAYAF